MRIGDRVETPRFCTVTIAEIFDDQETAYKAGFQEPSYYKGDFEIYGKSLDQYHMVFAAVKPRREN